MNVEVIPARALDDELADRWSHVQQLDERLASPYFCPHFTRLVASVRDDARLGIVHEHGTPVGFFPFQRMRFGRGCPIGGPLSDHHGVIAPPEADWPAPRLLRACGLNVWTFDHLAAHQFQQHHQHTDCSPIIALRDGYESYVQQRRASRSKIINKLGTLQRKLEREAGPLRFEVHTSDDDAFRQIIEWKSQQYRESGLVDVMSQPWVVALLDRLRRVQEPAFAGTVSALYAGEGDGHSAGRLIAGHIGMRSTSVWHYWFPAYDPAYASYSPGQLLLLMMIQSAEQLGISTIDLGKGESQYKRRLMNGAMPLAAGTIEVPSLTTALRHCRRGAEAWIRSTPLVRVARVPGRWITRFEHRARFR